MLQHELLVLYIVFGEELGLEYSFKLSNEVLDSLRMAVTNYDTCGPF